jgi:uncharacterized protein
MKFLLVLVFLLVVVWLWSHNRHVERERSRPSHPRQSPGEKNALTEIVACDVCHVHLPKSDALIGSSGVYCSEAHRRQADH